MLRYEVDATGIPDKYNMIDATLDRYPSQRVNDMGNLPTAIEGPPSLQARIRDLLLEYREIFRKEVSPVPADVPPMKIQVNVQKWVNMRNNGPPRVQSPEKDVAIREMCTRLQELKVLKPCNAACYSQVHLVPKGTPSERKWRPTIDFRLLNECCTPTGWRTPPVPEMFQRIGRAKPKYFAVIDQTSGYHQCPLDEGSQWLTAFITYVGIFHYTRVAQGLKGAPSYFQMTMVTIVLAGLVFVICENFLDDVITWGKTRTSY